MTRLNDFARDAVPCTLKLLRQRLQGVRVLVPELPDITGALGPVLHGAGL